MSVQESERVAHKAAGHKSKSPLKRENLWKKSEKKPSQMFNDPLYQYLDNQVFNREEHNFGPWIEMDAKSREKKTRDKQKSQRNLHQFTPTLYQTQTSPSRNQIAHYFNENDDMPHNNIRHQVLPNIQRAQRALSLRELRSVSLELNAPVRPSQVYKFHKQRSTSIQPFFLKGNRGLILEIKKNQNIFSKRSTFYFNKGFRDEETPALLNSKLRGKTDSPYLKLDYLCSNPELKARRVNENLARELKKYRLNKLK